MGLELAKAFVRVLVDSRRMKPGLADAERQFNDSLTRLATQAKFTLGGILGGFAVGNVLRLAGEYEQTAVAFEVMIGSAEKAQAMLAELNQFAAKTPFQLPGILGASQTLMGFGVEQDKILPTLQMLGDISAGTGKNLGELAVIYGQIRGMGRLMGQDFLQLVNAGFPVIEFANELGISMDELRERMSKGQIGFDVVERTMKRLTSNGGRYFQLMEKQSQTLLGKWSTLKDNFEMGLRDLGMQLKPFVMDTMEAVSKLLPTFLKFIKEGLVPVFKFMGAITKTVLPVFVGLMKATQPLLEIVGFLLTKIASTIDYLSGILTVGIAAWMAYRAAIMAYTASQIVALAVSGPAGWAVLAGAAGIAAVAVYGLTRSVEQYTKEASKAKDATDEWTKKLNNMSMAQLNKEMDEVTKKLTNWVNERQKARDHHEHLRTTWRPVFKGEREASEKRMANAERMVKLLQQQRKEIENRSKALKADKALKGADPNDAGDIFKDAAKLEDKFGLTTLEKIHAEMARVNIMATLGEISFKTYAAAMKDLKKQEDAATGGAKSYIKQLERQVKVLEIGEDAVRRMEMAKAGASMEDIKRVEQLQRKLKNLKSTTDQKAVIRLGFHGLDSLGTQIQEALLGKDDKQQKLIDIGNKQVKIQEKILERTGVSDRIDRVGGLF